MAFRMIEGTDRDQGIPKAMGAPGFLPSGFLPSFPPSLIKPLIEYTRKEREMIGFILPVSISLSIKFLNFGVTSSIVNFLLHKIFFPGMFFSRPDPCESIFRTLFIISFPRDDYRNSFWRKISSLYIKSSSFRPSRGTRMSHSAPAPSNKGEKR